MSNEAKAKLEKNVRSEESERRKKDWSLFFTQIEEKSKSKTIDSPIEDHYCRTKQSRLQVHNEEQITLKKYLTIINKKR
ncbi:hypothetical protein [Peribacillus frigoritolerans]|uniref:hypothetical protein n=1 Tax=Peribacillus frigoritolerans TaxID=450367 RepID=UPI003019D2C5